MAARSVAPIPVEALQAAARAHISSHQAPPLCGTCRAYLEALNAAR